MLCDKHNVELDIRCVEGPFQKGNGYSWWEMPPGVRSFTANEYGGFDEAADKVLKEWGAGPPYDLCLGHSQGAIMLAALITLGKVPYHPPMGYIFKSTPTRGWPCTSSGPLWFWWWRWRWFGCAWFCVENGILSDPALFYQKGEYIKYRHQQNHQKKRQYRCLPR